MKAKLVVSAPHKVLHFTTSDGTTVLSQKGATVRVVQLGIQGPAGAKGDQGIQGIQGPVGPQGAPGFTFTYNQLLPAQVWTIVHGQGGYPAVTIDVLGKGVSNAKMDYTDANTVTLTFTAPYAGKAYLKF